MLLIINKFTILTQKLSFLTDFSHYNGFPMLDKLQLCE